jgi:hypothetical protein
MRRGRTSVAWVLAAVGAVLPGALGTYNAAAQPTHAQRAMTFRAVSLHDPDITSSRDDARLVSDGRNTLLASVEHGYPNLVVTPGSPVPGFSAWTSRTGGRSWPAEPTEVASVPCRAASVNGFGQPAIAGSTAYWLQNCNTINTVYVSHDAGRSWAPTGQLVTGAAADEGYATVNSARPTELWTVTHLPAAAPRVIVVSHSRDGGSHFSPSVVNGHETAAQSADDAFNFFAPIQVDPRNPRRLYLFWIAGSVASRACTISEGTENVGAWHYMTSAFLAISSNAGASWREREIESLPTKPACNATSTQDPHPYHYDIANLFPESAVDAAGDPYLVYSQINPGRPGRQASHIVLLASRDLGAHFSRTQVDRAPWHSNFGPSIVAGARGEVDIAWQASRAMDELSPSAAWSVALAQSHNALRHSPRFRVTVVAADVHHGPLCPVSCSGTQINAHQTIGLATVEGRAALMWYDDSAGAKSTSAQERAVVAVQQTGPRI